MSSLDTLDYVYYENSESDDSVSFVNDFGTTLLIKETSTLAKTEFYNELNTLIRKSIDEPDAVNNNFPVKTEVSIEQSDHQQLIERINLYNKYCESNMLNIKFEGSPNGFLNASGLLKIHWKLKIPIRLENYVEVPVNFISQKDTSALKLANELGKSAKQFSYDDQIITKEISKGKNNLSRAKTISYRPKKFERKSILTKTSEENQLFIPAKSSVSSICIDSTTTCEQAIEILFEKYQISSQAEDFSLYKIQQNGDKKEFESNELILINRIWMGPFNEDKIVIMEKGVVLQVDHQIQTYLSLPLNLLEEFVAQLKKEEENDILAVRNRFEKYRELLNFNLGLIGEYI